MFFQIHILNFTKPKPTLSNFKGLKFERLFTSFNKKFLKKRYFFYWQKFPKKLSIYHQYLELLCIKHLLKDFCRKYSRKYTKPTLSFPLKTKLFIVRHLYPKINFRNLQSAASLNKRFSKETKLAVCVRAVGTFWEMIRLRHLDQFTVKSLVVVATDICLLWVVVGGRCAGVGSGIIRWRITIFHLWQVQNVPHRETGRSGHSHF